MSKPRAALPLATVGALVIGPSDRGLFIQTYKWKDAWAVPGGKIDYGESMTAALKREFHEETGLSLSHIYWAPVQEAVNSTEFYKDAHFILLNFVAYTDNEEVALNEEAETYAWLEPTKALSYHLNTPTRKLVEFYLSNRNDLKELA